MPDVSCIIVSWNSKDLVAMCLESVVNHESRHELEVILVDNGSTDGLQDMVRERFPSVILIENGENYGFAKAYNIGMRAASGTWWAVLNSDIILLPGCIDELVTFHEANPQAAIVSPRLRNPEMKPHMNCREAPGFWNNVWPITGMNRLFPKSKFFSGELMYYFDLDRVRRVPVIAGSFWMVRREAAGQVGLMDERFFFYSEDADWCRRFRSAGWEVVFNPAAEAIHHHAGSSSAMPVKYYIQRHIAILQYWQKYRGITGRYLITGVIELYECTRTLFFVLKYLVGGDGKALAGDKAALHWACFTWMLGHLGEHPDRMRPPS